MPHDELTDEQRSGLNSTALMAACELFGQGAHAELIEDVRNGNADAVAVVAELRQRRKNPEAAHRPSTAFVRYTSPKFVRWTTAAPRLRREPRRTRPHAMRSRRASARSPDRPPRESERPLAARRA